MDSMERLEDPKKQIRLLKLLPGASRDDICLGIETFYVHDAPSYLAISYAWGDPDELRLINVNEECQFVRANCHFALWQARLHYADSWIWIDSLSINQNDLEEKGHQVNIMGKVYASALLVLACIGPRADDLQVVTEFAPELESCDLDADVMASRIGRGKSTRATPTSVPAPDAAATTAFLQRVIPGRTYTPSIAESFRQACHHLARRSYWKRLWIAQELALSREKVILCGSRIYPWRVVSNLILYNSYLAGPALILDTTEPLLIVESVINGGPPRSLFRSLAMLQCDDPRDRVYGTLGFIDWHCNGESIYPDYRRHPVDLAKMILTMPSMADSHEDIYRMLGVLDVMKYAAAEQEEKRGLEAQKRKAILEHPGEWVTPVVGRPQRQRDRASLWLSEHWAEFEAVKRKGVRKRPEVRRSPDHLDLPELHE